MSTLRTPNNEPMDENPNVDRTMHVEEPAFDQTLRPAGLDAVDNMSESVRSMDTTFVSGDNTPVVEDTSAEYFNLKGVRYKKKSVLSENSGEAQVYLVEKDGEEYVLKIYYPTFNVNKKLL